ncbi:restriction endonuclease subunit S [Aliarcobacter butzleri]|uniref:restriction endonuclease subunit S n=1 Tax=Aliarcobacter butzleri TaxID=28197 RepID=UPI001EDBA111|nr:restriction endonuclease subunit S [Aliarcobacter butzleri]MCG3712661.1 restriction endonuclease subunit S [Aliarcobacter butzleri]
MSNVPKLRFKEFNEEWEEKTFKELTKINQGLQIPISDRYLEQVENSFFYITNEFLKDGSKNKYFIKNPPESVLCKEEDILMTRTGNTGQVVTNITGAFHNNFFKIKYSKDLNKNFLVEFLRLESTQNMILRYAGTSTIPDLNHGDFYRLKINLPSKQEQEKIALFFTSIDTKIEQLSKKEELLQQYKKGVMQKIFNQEIRFKADDGSEFCEWEEKKLGQIGKFHAGGDLTKLNYSKEKSNEYVYPIYANGSGEGLYGYATTFQYKSNCVTVSGRGTLGHANLRKENFNAIVRLIVIEPKSSICGNFLKEAINRINFSIESTGVPQLTIPQISLYKVFLPCLEEQNKIAIFLSSIDTKIEQTQKQLELSKEFKKGLLQQMFI